MRRRRIAVVSPRFPPYHGGLETYAYEVARRVAEDGRFDVTVITSNHDGSDRVEAELGGLPVIRLGTQRVVSDTPVGLGWPAALRRTFRDLGIELVHAHTPVPYMAECAALAAGHRPVVVTYHSGSMVRGSQPIDTAVRLYEGVGVRYLLRRASAAVTVSDPVASWLRRSYGVTPLICPPGVDSDRFRPSGQPPPTPTILYVGRVDRASAWKGLDVLQEAFGRVAASNTELRLHVVGGGDALEDLRHQVSTSSYAERVWLPGFLSGDDLVRAYQSASALVLPSRSENESFGICLIEAMSCGLAVIGSRIGGIPFVVDHAADGLLVPPNDPGALAGAIEELVSDPARCRRLGETGRAKVMARFVWDRVAEDYGRLFGTLLETPDG